MFRNVVFRILTEKGKNKPKTRKTNTFTQRQTCLCECDHKDLEISSTFLKFVEWNYKMGQLIEINYP